MSANNHDVPYRFEIVPVKHMFTDDDYQRKLTSFVKKLEEDWNPALVGTVILSERSKTKMALIDGQTRAEGARRVGVKELPALIYMGLTKEEEAELFALFQTQRRSMHSADRFRAEVVAGHPIAVAIDKVTREYGYVIANGPTSIDGLTVITAPAALEYVYRGAKDKRAKFRESPELLGRTLEVLTKAWPKKPETARSAVILKGLGLFLAKEGRVDEERLATRLGKVQPTEIAKRAQALREGRGITGTNPRETAEAIQAQYNRR